MKSVIATPLPKVNRKLLILPLLLIQFDIFRTLKSTELTIDRKKRLKLLITIKIRHFIFSWLPTNSCCVIPDPHEEEMSPMNRKRTKHEKVQDLML